MKEADITWGTAYAIDDGDGRVVCRLVVRKVPPAPGNKRSRQYIISTLPDKDGNRYEEQIDASKIKFLWSEYEKTDEYLWKHANKVRESLADGVRREGIAWAKMVQEYVLTCIPEAERTQVYMSAPRAGMCEPLGDFDELRKQLLSGSISMPLSTFVEMTKLPLPDAPSVRSALEQAQDLVAEVERQRLPVMERQLRKVLTDENYLTELQIREYVQQLRAARVTEPNEFLKELALRFPQSSAIVNAAHEPDFSYLLSSLYGL